MRRKKTNSTTRSVCVSQTTQKQPEAKMKRRKLYDVYDMDNGETAETCEEHKKAMVTEMTKTNKRYRLIKELMELTYPYRRQQFINEPKVLNELLTEYPALQLVSEVRINIF